MGSFKLVSDFSPKGDQPKAIDALAAGIDAGKKHQTLLGITGSGKTFTMANVIARLKRPTIILSHNKTLAAQLYSEFKSFFPDNAVEYFVSYYDYYMPEAYIPSSDTYISKEVQRSEELERLRFSTTRSLMTRRDVIVVASVSCIFGLGDPKEWDELHLYLKPGMEMDREKILEKLVELQYERNDIDLKLGRFRVRGDTIELFPSYGDAAIRIELFGDEVERISEINHVTGNVTAPLDELLVHPAKHYVTSPERLESIVGSILFEMEEIKAKYLADSRPLEAERIEQRTKYDMEMLTEVGYCQGIENYSMYMDGRTSGERPYVLLDYFPKDFLMFIDESHVTVPQVRGMYLGDRSRKKTLVDFGFRLPSALENRPLKFEEFESMQNQVVFVSATPTQFELEASGDAVEQIIRPTGLVDPELEVRPIKGQIDDLLAEIRERVERKERVLVTTLTKRMAEDISDYYAGLGVKVRYLHSDIDTLDRVDILHDLQNGVFDVLIGINLLREGLDLPQVSLVAILDADKEGFLRTETTLIQTIGRASRNVNGKVILYGDKVTKSMKAAIETTERRRKLQQEFNKKHGIEPATIQKQVREFEMRKREKRGDIDVDEVAVDEIAAVVKDMEQEMFAAAKRLDFELAATLRDKLKELREKL